METISNFLPDVTGAGGRIADFEMENGDKGCGQIEIRDRILAVRECASPSPFEVLPSYVVLRFITIQGLVASR